MRLHPERLGDREQVCDAEIADPALDPAHVAAIDTGEIGEGILTELPRFAQLADADADGLEMGIERGLPRLRRHLRIVRRCGRSPTRTIVHNIDIGCVTITARSGA